MAHRGHPVCAFTTKAACEKARREALGQCQALVGDKDPKQCAHLALSEDGYCGGHLNVLTRRLEGTWMQRRIDEKKAELAHRIDEFIEWQKDHPSVWDRRL